MITLNDCFDKIYLINLKSRTDKLKLSIGELNKYNIKFEVFCAVEGNPGVQLNSPFLLNRPGAVGCALSHIEIIKLAKKQNLKNVLIFEDDIELTQDFSVKFDSFIRQLPDNWDMFYLGGSGHTAPNSTVISYISKNIAKTTGTYTTSSYAVKESLFDIIIEGASKMVEPIDNYYKYRIQPNYNCYVTRPNLIWQKPGKSDISHTFRDYTSFMKE